MGSHAAVSLAETLGASGTEVRLLTPYRQVGNSLGGQTYPLYLESLYRSNVRMQPDTRVIGITRKDNRLTVTTRNLYSRETVEQTADMVVIEQGTIPITGLFDALRPSARNAGITDWDAPADRQPQPVGGAPGELELYAIGDALSSRDMHSAMFDGNRLCRTI